METDEARQRRQSRQPVRLALPSPRPTAVAIAVTVVEVQAGVRSPRRLERLSHYSLWPLWDLLADQPVHPAVAAAAKPLTVVVQEHTPGLVDATVVVGFGRRAEPLGLRLDGARGHWELMELECSSAFAPELPARILDPPTAGLPTVDTVPMPAGRSLHRTAPPLEMPWPAQLDLKRQPEPLDGLGIDLA